MSSGNHSHMGERVFFVFTLLRFSACITDITFDDISGQSSVSGVIPNGYKNLNWSNAEYVNVSTEPPSGYQIANTASSFVAHNPSQLIMLIQSANGTHFAFHSLNIASAWRDNLKWTIYGFRSGILRVRGSFSLSAINRTTISCSSCSNLDTLYFESGGGTPRTGLAQNGTEFALDNLCISFGY